jgi:hypothetical protein
MKYLPPVRDDGTMSPMTRVTAALLCAFLLLNGCATGCADRVRGSGVVKVEPRDVAGFSEVKVRGSGDVTIAVDSSGTESLTVEAEDNLLPLLTSDVEDGVLVLGVREGANVSATRPIRYRLTARELNGVSVSGSGSVRASGINAAKFVASISGSGGMDLSGAADEMRLTISGSGSYDAAHLRAKSARVKISGSGDANVNASESLEAHISGSGSVRYGGNPKVEKHIAGSGSVARK